LGYIFYLTNTILYKIVIRQMNNFDWYQLNMSNSIIVVNFDELN